MRLESTFNFKIERLPYYTCRLLQKSIGIYFVALIQQRDTCFFVVASGACSPKHSEGKQQPDHQYNAPSVSGRRNLCALL